MRRGIVVLLLLVVVLAAGLGAGWWWARTAPQQAVDLLASAGLDRSRAEALVASLGGQVAVEQAPAALAASGTIEGVQAAVVSELGGRIAALAVDTGAAVDAGQVVVELDDSQLRAQMAQAQAAVAAARANLETVRAGTHPAEILTAEAALAQAQAQRDAAETAWHDAQAILDDPQEIEAQIAQAQAQLDVAQAQIESAQAQVAAAEVERDRYVAQGTMDEKWLYQVYSYQLEAAQQGVEVAKENAAGAADNLAALQALRANPLALVSQVHAAEAAYRTAEAGVTVAEAQLAELKAGPTPEEVRVAETQVTQAEAAVAGFQVQIDKTRLTAPLSGIVTSLPAHAGEAALPGATLLTVTNLDELKLTIYVPETELGRVYVGQAASVTVDAYAGRVFTGTVAHIAQQAEFTPKNVQTASDRVNMVFAVRIRLPNPEHLLKPGMPADAELQETGQ